MSKTNECQFSFFHFFVDFTLREPRTQRSEFSVCRLRTRAWSRAWASHKASCSSCRPSRLNPTPCSSRWEAAVQLQAHMCASQPAVNTHTYFVLHDRRTRTFVAEFSSWRRPCSSGLSSSHSWRGRANTGSGEEERSWENGKTEWGSWSWSWIKKEERSQLWRWTISMGLWWIPEGHRYIYMILKRCKSSLQYVTQTVEVESPATVKQLTKARQRNEVLSERLSSQNERCKQLEEQIRKSDEYSCNLQHKVSTKGFNFQDDFCLNPSVFWRT